MKGISTRIGLGSLSFLVAALAVGFSASAHDFHGIQKMHSQVPFFLTQASKQPQADVLYYGGPVLSNVKIISVMWGSQVDSTVQAQIPGFYSTVVNSTYIDWLSEYDTNVTPASGGKGTDQMIARGTYGGSVTITPSKTATTIDDTDIQSELVAQISKGSIPAADANTLYVFHFPPNLTITLANGGQQAASCQDFCAYHGATTTDSGQNLPYAVMPDMGGNCSFGCGNSTNGFDIFTNVVSHEIMEAITDPFVMLDTTAQPEAPLAWYDTANGEIADICQGTAGKITGSNNTSYVVQGGWSQKNSACVTSF